MDRHRGGHQSEHFRKSSQQQFGQQKQPEQFIQSSQQQSGQSQDPNFKFCSFCKGDTTRRDNLRFTHWLFDKATGAITCPFLLRTVCQVCYEKGHTTRNCKNQFKLDAMRMEAMSVREGDGKAKMAAMALDDELMRRRWVSASLLEKKHCNFCANGKYQDDFFKTHNLYECPRLACMTCNYCGVMGHTAAKCPKKQLDEGVKDDVDNKSGEGIMVVDLDWSRYMEGSFVFDFDADEIVAMDSDAQDTGDGRL